MRKRKHTKKIAYHPFVRFGGMYLWTVPIVHLVWKYWIKCPRWKSAQSSAQLSEAKAMNLLVHDILSEKRGSQEYHDAGDKIIPSNHCTPADVIASLFVYGIAPSRNPEQIRPISAWSIPSSDKGLRGHLQDVIPPELIIDPNAYSTTIIPPATCSTVHVDFFVRSATAVIAWNENWLSDGLPQSVISHGFQEMIISVELIGF